MYIAIINMIIAHYNDKQRTILLLSKNTIQHNNYCRCYLAM